MIARKVKPGVMKIINAPFEDMIESYTLLNIGKEDALDLLFAATDVKRDDDGSFVIKYDDNEPVSRMFKAIAYKHEQSNPDFISVNVRYELDMDAIPGTSVLVRDPEKQTIKIAYRRSTNFLKTCGINRLFVTNATRDAFFDDVRVGPFYKRTNKYMLSKADSEAAYSKWAHFMNERYLEIVASLKGAKKNGNH